MSELRLNDVLKFSRLLNAFTSVERVCYHPGNNLKENDSEHSYQLAMLAWYIADCLSLDLDKDLMLRYALIHDLVEVYAGDTYVYSENENDHSSKKEREELARLQILEEFPLFSDLHTTILNYEKREDKESRFVYVLDKIHPEMQIYLDKGRTWGEMKVTLSMLLEKKKDKMNLAPELLPLWNELEELLARENESLFYKK